MKHFLTAMALASVATGAMADVPLWLRDTSISPDGTTIAFTYKGDIFTVPVSGGNARQITTNKAYDSRPVWSPDGSKLAFRSNRRGSDDIFVVDAIGGTPRRLTSDSGQETPVGFLDNETLVFLTTGMPSQESVRWPLRYPIPYTVDITKDNPRPQLLMSVPMNSLSATSDGRILYTDKKGVENVFRKHERSSGTNDVWLIDNGIFTKLTDFNGHDMCPVWGADGKSYFYISEEDGTLNVFARNIDGSSKRQLTKFEKHPVRSLSASTNGTLAFSWDGEVYTMREGEQPRKVDINIVTDDYDSDLIKKIINSGASGFTVSPDGSEVALILRGDIYVTSSDYKTTRRITDTPAQERSAAFSPDGKSLVYDSDRDGYWQLFIARPAGKDDKNFAYASEISETPLYKCATAAQQPKFSPDGKKVAFLENRTELRVIDVDSKEVVTALPGKYNYSYTDGDITFDWSPDSRWLLTSYIGEGGWNNIDVAAVKADGSEVVNLTESGFSNMMPRWSMDGRAVTYIDTKYGMKSQGSWGNTMDVVLMALDGEAWDEFNSTKEEVELREKADKEKKEAETVNKDKKDKKNKKDKTVQEESKPELTLDFGGRRYRVARLTDVSTDLSDYYLTPKGDKLFYIAVDATGDTNLFMHDLKEGDVSAVMENVSGMEADAKGEHLFVYSNGSLFKYDISKSKKDKVEFDALYDRTPSLEREYIYSHMLRQVNDKFYDEALHGVDWNYYGEHYRKFLPHVNNNRDFADLMSEILGELNASHTGAGAGSGSPQLPVAVLGAFYDNSYNGDGLKVSEVIAGGPLSRKKANVGKGDVILAIDGCEIKAGEDYASFLEGKTGRKVSLKVRKQDGSVVSGEARPISAGVQGDLLYNRWVERNEHIVDSVSGGKIGYVHVRNMNSPSFRAVYERLLGKYRNCDAVVVDTRYNGGGWLHNDLAVLLNGKEYVRFSPRGQYIGSEPFSQWTKPSVMLVNESNYSDAHGSPYTYQTLGIGEIIGAPIPGTMTAVWWERQIDSDLVFGIPQVTSLNMNGKPLENNQLTPDVEVYNDPAEVERGYDAQLVTAVKHLMNKTRH